LSGGSYLITGTALSPLLAAAQIVPFLWIDDIYLSMLAEKAGVNLFGFFEYAHKK